MARYRAKAMLYENGRLIMPAEEFESDTLPGRNWEPLDDAAREKVAALKPVPPATVPITAMPMVAIPSDWRNLDGRQQINLAVKLGAPRQGTTTKVAIDWIERELAQRVHTSHERSRDAVNQEA